jgi:hypothetical protein
MTIFMDKAELFEVLKQVCRVDDIRTIIRPTSEIDVRMYKDDKELMEFYREAINKYNCC